ncbi:PH domain-containing protein [Rugosimonospora africana]|uniref:YdbS-like PH domain-containing protein n=1 Tax=Rugosimonospora africana TaxID=556532 RepID=A0A8J3VSI4_9ACTN|nr:PH domain-containing protein [Rugosimonospora africana]GIH16498.1 hypothetical protein Raf01_46700 [Rugosimonospora africana]
MTAPTGGGAEATTAPGLDPTGLDPTGPTEADPTEPNPTGPTGIGPGHDAGHAATAGTGPVAAARPGPEWRRLSPRMLAVHPVQETLRALPALLAVLVAGRSSGHSAPWALAGVAVTVGLGILRWATTSYQVSADQVQVRRGFLRRRVVSIPRDRVRTVDLTAHPLHRLLRLSRITIGTGQSDRKEGLRLDGLTSDEAVRLRTELLHRTAQPTARPSAGSSAPSRVGSPAVPPVPAQQTAASGTPDSSAPGSFSLGSPAPALSGVPVPASTPWEPGETVLASLRPGWVRYGPFTLSGLVTIGIVFGFLYRIVSEAHLDPGRLGPLRAIGHQLQRVPLGVAVTEVVLAAIVLVAVASTLGYVIAFWSFRLSRQDSGTLHVARGLLTTRATTLEERRLRGVELSEPLLLRAVRGGRCIAIATGLRVGRGAERGGSLLLPPAPVREARRVATAVLGDAEPMTVTLRAHGPRARRRRYIRALTLAAIVPAGLALLWGLADWPGWAPLVGLLTLPAGALLAADRYRSLGHALTAGHLVVRQGSVVRRRCALARDGIIGWHLHQSVFQRRAGLVTVIATTAAGRQRYTLPDVDVNASASLVDSATPELLTPFLVR